MKTWFQRRRTATPAPGVASPAAPAHTAPLSAVAAAITQGETTVAGIAACTGLRTDTIAAAIEHLERTGYLRRSIDISCGGSCGGCELATDSHHCSHSPDTTTTQKGLVTLTLTGKVPGAPTQDDLAQ